MTTELRLQLSPDGRTVVAIVSPWDTTGRTSRALIALDLATRQERPIASHGPRLTCLAISSSGKLLVTGDDRGTVRVGPIDGGEPHLLMGHGGPVASVAVSPDGQWIASAAGSEMRLWPMPDVSRPPSHTLPYAELMAKLRALTNLQVVADPEAAAGYKI